MLYCVFGINAYYRLYLSPVAYHSSLIYYSETLSTVSCLSKTQYTEKTHFSYNMFQRLLFSQFPPWISASVLTSWSQHAHMHTHSHVFKWFYFWCNVHSVTDHCRGQMVCFGFIMNDIILVRAEAQEWRGGEDSHTHKTHKHTVQVVVSYICEENCIDLH